jgi:hypothetical protein
MLELLCELFRFHVLPSVSFSVAPSSIQTAAVAGAMDHWQKGFAHKGRSLRPEFEAIATELGR